VTRPARAAEREVAYKLARWFEVVTLQLML